jgi:hypothetical protein
LEGLRAKGLINYFVAESTTIFNKLYHH